MAINPTGADFTKSGLTTRSFSDIRQALVDRVNALSPGVTDLPGSLIEDMLSTAVASIQAIEQERVNIINSLLPSTSANNILPLQMGLYGVTPYAAMPTSVLFRVVSTSKNNLFIKAGIKFTVGGTMFVSKEFGTTATDGGLYKTSWLFAEAEDGQSNPLPNLQTELVSSFPGSVDAPIAPATEGLPLKIELAPSGVSQGMAEIESLPRQRARIIAAIQKTTVGSVAYIRDKILNADPRVDERLLSIRLITSPAQGGTPENPRIKIIVGGKQGAVPDSAKIGEAIFNSVLFVPFLSGKTNAGITKSYSATYAGQPYSVSYVIPKEIKLTFTATLTLSPKAPVSVSKDGISAVVSPVVFDYINALPTGSELSMLTLKGLITSVLDNTHYLVSSLVQTIVLAIEDKATGTSLAWIDNIHTPDDETFFSLAGEDITIA